MRDFLFKLAASLLGLALFFGLLRCSPDTEEAPTINSFTLNGQNTNTVLVLPDTLAVEALLKDPQGLGTISIAIRPLFSFEVPVIPSSYSLDTLFSLYGTASLVSKRLPLAVEKVLGGLYEVTILVTDSDGNAATAQTRAFEVVNSKPELILTAIPETASVQNEQRIAFQVRNELLSLSGLRFDIRQRFEVEEGVFTYADAYFYEIGYTSFGGKLVSFSEAFAFEQAGTYELNITAQALTYTTSWQSVITVQE